MTPVIFWCSLWGEMKKEARIEVRDIQAAEVAVAKEVGEYKVIRYPDNFGFGVAIYSPEKKCFLLCGCGAWFPTVRRATKYIQNLIALAAALERCMRLFDKMAKEDIMVGQIIDVYFGWKDNGGLELVKGVVVESIGDCHVVLITRPGFHDIYIVSRYDPAWNAQVWYGGRQFPIKERAVKYLRNRVGAPTL